MKVTAAALFLIAQFSGAMAAAVSADAAECGSLGVLDTKNVRAGADLSKLRKCSGHPMGRDRDLEHALLGPLISADSEAAQNAAPLDARSVIPALSGRGANACWFGASYGCSKNFCWRNCGPNGQWCWTATNSGSGEWIGCNAASQCADLNAACGKDCKKDDKSCGCSC
ncbi:hypothetical protein Dda_4297 [Drechslerella dactyloides]|uniref:IDI-2 n=1 Tax=Drechslerella dactyloides TaxID=74499 RepID=A0AAD6J3X7_DREDA|nr:hypothetical protein Dda_4297 [Drechslerella dactyloides]